MLDLKVPDSLWASTILPEGVLEWRLVSDVAAVRKGDPIATIRIEEALHEVTAPAQGRLPITIGGNDVIEPGISSPLAMERYWQLRAGKAPRENVEARRSISRGVSSEIRRTLP
jgi:hypothetical protein